jgi:hypothetical protein
MIATQDDPNFEAGQFAMAYLLAELHGDEQTKALIRATVSDPWPLVGWLAAAASTWIVIAGEDPVCFARRTIAEFAAAQADHQCGGEP